MALRNEMEHSYRTLAIDVLASQVQERATAIIETVDLATLTNEAGTCFIEKALDLANLKFAIRWLTELDEKLCPEVKELTEQVNDRILNKEDPNKVLDDIISLLESL